MRSSLVKFSQQNDAGEGKKLFWNRVEADGAPYRGPMAPMLTESEYEQNVVRVADVRNNFFDATVPVENKAYLDVLERCANGWFRLIHIERFWNQTTKHYVEWAEYYMEDGRRTPYATPGFNAMELGNGSTNGH